jgi:PTH1 family peptidyl-tRNA hydrolase
MKRTLVVGLGNPGSKYHATRHNIGFAILDRLAYDLNIDMNQSKFNAHYGQGQLNHNHAITLLKPQTFMNLSGKSVAPCLKFFQLPPQQLIVVHDELEFPFSKIRIKAGGGHAGHNGLRSIIDLIGNRDFIRIRVGIGRPKHGSVSDYVLQRFTADEQAWTDDVCRQVSKDICDVIEKGTKHAMNDIHARPLLYTPLP